MTRAIVIALLLVASCEKPKESTTTATTTTTTTATTTATTTTTTTATTTATATAPDTIIAQHVLVAYKGAKRMPKGVVRSKGEAKARAEEALAKVRAGTAFEEVVKAYSDDTGSADRMGSVGKFHREDMDPNFSKAAFALKVGEVSDVVETPFGFHLIKRTQ
jgi:hypothetical protein